MNILKKFIVFAKSGGIREAISYSIHTLRSYIYVHSQTFFLYLKVNSTEKIDLPSNISFKIVEDVEELIKFKFSRLNSNPINKWFSEGAVCQIGFINNKPVSYIWIHKKTRNIHHALKIILNSKQFWIGPVFVHKDARGKGLNKLQIQYLINNQSFKNCEFFTCTNSKNFASVKSFLKRGFKLVLVSDYKYKLFNIPKKDIIELEEKKIRFEL